MGEAVSCGWPFHHQPGCEECAEWERKHGEAITLYMDSLAEIKAQMYAERAARLRITPATARALEQPGSE